MKRTRSGDSLVIQSKVPHYQQKSSNNNNRPSPRQQQQGQNYQQNSSYLSGCQQQQASQQDITPYKDTSYLPYQQQHQPRALPPQQNGQRNIVLICNLDPRATAEDVGVNMKNSYKKKGEDSFIDILLNRIHVVCLVQY
jgi:uncharacterized protein (UPF0303 family)